MDKRKLTPPEVARRWGVKPAKVIGWIVAGELRAINAAASAYGRPRYLIDIDDLAVFEAKRTVGPLPKVNRICRSSPDVPQIWK